MTLKKHAQKDAYTSPWNKKTLILKLLFNITWILLCRWTPKNFIMIRLYILRCFGADISGRPFIDSSSRIHFPWNLKLGDHACLARRTDIYNLDIITVESRAVVAQDTMLCCGTHDFSSDKFELMTAPIWIEAGAFIGARSIILPGAHIAKGTIVGAGAVLSGQTEPNMIYAGNPAKLIGRRRRDTPPETAA